MTPVPLLVFLYVGFFVLPEDVDAARRVEGEQQLIKRGGRADVVERELDVLKAEEPAGLWAVSHARAFGEQKHTLCDKRSKGRHFLRQKVEDAFFFITLGDERWRIRRVL